MRIPIQLNQRERFAVGSVLTLVGILIVAEWGVFPVIEHRKTLEQAIRSKSFELEEIEGLRNDFLRMKQKTEATRSRLARREKGFTLFSYLDRSAGKAGVKEQIAYMKPSGKDLLNGEFKAYQVEMKLQSISLHQLSAFLYEVETVDPLVIVKKASMVRIGQSVEGIDVVLWVETIAP